MNFFFVAPRYHPNQIPIMEKLIEEEHKVNFYVITEEGSEDHTIVKPKYIKSSLISKIFIKTSPAKRKFLIPSIFYMLKEFKMNKPDVCIIRNPQYLYSIAFILFASFNNSKIILYTQDKLYLEKFKIRHRFYYYLIKIFKAKWVTPVLGSVNMGEKFCSEIYHLPLPVNIQNREHKIKQNEKIQILMIGKFLTFKRHDLLILAIKELNKKYHNLSVTIIGECTTEEHKKVYRLVLELINNNEIRNISMKVNVDHNKMLEIYTDYDLFVLPSSSETFGFSSLEALSNGLPVIISNQNGFKYYVENGIVGYVFDAGSLVDLTSKLELALKNGKYIEMGKEAFKYVEQNFTKEIYYKKLVTILESYDS